TACVGAARRRGVIVRRDRGGPRPGSRHRALATAPRTDAAEGEAGAVRMTCIETRDLFSALADDALTRAERAALDTHLAFCAECRRELARFERTVKLVRALDPAHAPAGFVDRVLAAAQPAPWPRRLARRVMRPWPTLPLSAAALLVVGGLAVLLFRGSLEQQRAARYQSEAPPAPTTAPPPSERAAKPVPATPEPQQPAVPERQQPAPPASELPRGYGETANKRAETSAETKAPSDEARNVAPPSAAESFRAKGESTERAHEKSDAEREPPGKVRQAGPPSPEGAPRARGAPAARRPAGRRRAGPHCPLARRARCCTPLARGDSALDRGHQGTTDGADGAALTHGANDGHSRRAARRQR